jgi:hypothetical protein
MIKSSYTTVFTTLLVSAANGGRSSSSGFPNYPEPHSEQFITTVPQQPSSLTSHTSWRRGALLIRHNSNSAVIFRSISCA